MKLAKLAANSVSPSAGIPVTAIPYLEAGVTRILITKQVYDTIITMQLDTALKACLFQTLVMICHVCRYFGTIS